MKRTDVINYIIEQKGYNSYLEIGIQNVEQNFDHIKIDSKVGVDPANSGDGIVRLKSDSFFAQNKDVFDVIFIDGDHSHQQSTKDFQNALKCLSEGGCILMHDVLPHNEEYTNPEWCGEVWKTAVNVANNFTVTTFAGDHGVLVCFPELTDSNEHSFAEYPGLDELKNALGAVDSLDSIVLPAQLKVDLGTAYDGIDLDAMPDEWLRREYENVFGKKAGGRTKRETIISKLYEAFDSDTDNS